MAKKVFISYSRLDLAIATDLHSDLTAAGFRAFLDKKDLLGGEDWKHRILREIKGSDRFIALLSNHSLNKKGYFQKELRMALAVLDECPVGDNFIVPVRLEDCQPREPRVCDLHWIDLFPEYEAGVQKLVKAIGDPQGEKPHMEPGRKNEGLSRECRQIMKKRSRIPSAIQVDILTRSRRRCCLCAGLNRDFDLKRGQLAHIDGNPSDSRPDNLAFLCLNHHDEYDGSFKQSKGITAGELRSFRDDLYIYVERNFNFQDMPATKPTDEPLLMLEGDVNVFQEHFLSAMGGMTDSVHSLREIFGNYNSQEAKDLLAFKSASPKNETVKRFYFQRRGDRLLNVAREINSTRNHLASSAERTLKIFNGLAVLTSDLESANRSLFLPYQDRVTELGSTMRRTDALATSILEKIRTVPRSIQAFNKGKRVFMGSLEALILTVKRIEELCDETSAVLNRLTELL